MPVDPVSSLPPLPRLRSEHDVLIVVPTCGRPPTVVPGVRRILTHTDGLRVCVIVVANPDDSARWAESKGMIDAAAESTEADVHFLDLGAPVGFGAAVNRGIENYLIGRPAPAHIVVINDDAHVSAGWLSGMIDALDPVDGVVLTGEPRAADGVRPRRDTALAVGRSGRVGPGSTLVAGVAQVRIPDALRGAPYDVTAAQVRQQAGGEVEVVDFLSGFCVLYRRECLLDLMAEGHGKLFDERFRIGGYEDNDVCVRADLAGWGRVVARSVYVHHDGHQTLDRIAPGAKRGMANRIEYARKWASTPECRPGNVVAVYRVRLETAQDIAYLRASIERMSELVDGFAIVLNGNPLDITSSQDWAPLSRQLPVDDHSLLRACSGKDEAGVAVEFAGWVTAAARTSKDSRCAKLGVRVEVWTGAFNERDERNCSIDMAEQMGAAWVFSVDHDEVPEARVDRAMLDRLMSCPDPLIQSWDVGFMTLWDTPAKHRIDRPWGDGGSYTGGMRGFRFFRASRSTKRPRRIAAGNAIGLHCGNVPDADPLAKRVSSIRMLHYGYLRPWDRRRKHERYARLDPNPDAAATGGGYGHLIHEESCILSPVVPIDGIGLTMLLHPGETAIDLARQLDQYHGAVDAVVLVWTGDEAPGAVGGASDDMREIAALYGATWTHQPLADDFAAARNTGLDALRAHRWAGRPPLGWALTVDPDEMSSDPFGDVVSMRRMAECSDAHGWLFRFANHRPTATGEPPTASESIRMVRLDPGAVIRYSGRVHEGFDSAFKLIDRPVVRYAPFTTHNPGLGTDPAELDRKARFYQRLLVAELCDNPRNGSAWVSLGMQYTNDGFHDRAIECFQRAIASEPNGYLGYRELALAKLREARVLYECVAGMLPPAHGYHRVAADGVRFMQSFAPDQPTIGLAALGPEHVPPEADVPLPEFPPVDGPGDDDEAKESAPE